MRVRKNCHSRDNCYPRDICHSREGGNLRIDSRLRGNDRGRSTLLITVVLLFLTSGCTSEFNLATQKEELYLYGTDREVNIGHKVSRAIEKRYNVVVGVEENERVNSILDRIVEVSDRKDIVYFIKILDKDIVNAVSLPGGYIYMFQGLMDKIESDDQLAGVIAHEVAHITAKHGIKRLQASYAALALQLASTQAGGQVAGGVNFALTSLFLGYSQKAELESDKLAVKYMKDAGFDPKGMTEFLEILMVERDKSKIREYTYWKTHPNIPRRIGYVNKEITGQLEFEDYIKIIGN